MASALQQMLATAVPYSHSYSRPNLSNSGSASIKTDFHFSQLQRLKHANANSPFLSSPSAPTFRSLKSLQMCKSTISVGQTEWIQKTFSLPPYKRGCHIITHKIYEAVPEIREVDVGLANLFILHTSASLTVNENASSDVPLDMEDALNKIVPEGNHYRHLDEGYDDMPAHVKASMMGCSLTIPVKAGRFVLGIWQGIWLNEHRDYGGPRRICITLQGMKRTG